MEKYLYYADGLKREIWSKPAMSERDAYIQVYNDLSESDKNNLGQLDCIECIMLI